jgi:hypothetical protein
MGRKQNQRHGGGKGGVGLWEEEFMRPDEMTIIGRYSKNATSKGA